MIISIYSIKRHSTIVVEQRVYRPFRAGCLGRWPRAALRGLRRFALPWA